MNPPTYKGATTYGSVCSGIEAPSAAWHPLGWKPLWFSEIEPFPKAVLAHRYPEVPDLGDMTTLPARILAGEVPDVDVFVGGTPCQSFSVAGLRLGLADPRGQLTRTYVEILDALDTVRLAKGKPPTVALWENVPGVLSDKDNAYGNFLGALCGEDDALLPAGPKWTNAGSVLGPRRSLAWRVLDAQYFGVAQRRRRVFLVASARASGVDPVEVLLVEQGVLRDPPSRGEAGAAATAAARAGAQDGGEQLAGGERGGRGGRGVASSHWDGDYPHPTLNQAFNTGGIGQSNQELLSQRGSGLVPVEVALLASYPSVVGTLSDGAHNGGGLNGQDAYTGRILPVMAHGPIAVTASREIFTGDGVLADPIGANEANTYTNEGSNNFRLHNCVGEPRGEPNGVDKLNDGIVGALTARGGRNAGMANDDLDARRFALQAMAVRRLTPVECERLQGFPADYTAIPWRNKTSSECPDGPRYKALGNSMAVPVIRWLGVRIGRSL